MRTIIFFLLTAFLLAGCSSKTPVRYTVSMEDNDGSKALNVLMAFPANKTGETRLVFPNTAWGQDSLHNVIASVELIELEGEVIKNPDSGWVVIKHDPGLDELVLEYKIRQDFEGELTTENDFRPIINDSYFHVYSHNLFMLPQQDSGEEEVLDMTIEWVGFPEGYGLQNSFGVNQRFQEIQGISEEKFHSALFMGGDVRVHEIDIDGNKVYFGIRGDWEVFRDSTLIAALDQTIQVQRDFWQDHSQPYYSVTMIPTVQEQGYSFHGTGLTNSFALTASNNEFLEVEGLVYLINHELQHNWTGTLIKNANEEEQYWFSEGFTEYYTLKNIAANGIYDLDKSYFIREFNRLMRELFTSPVKDAPNSDINYDNFWTSRHYSKLPYYRGALFAFYLDNKISKDSQGAFSLDDLMLQIKRDAVDSGQLLDHDYFLKTANSYLNEDLSPFFSKHILEGELMDLSGIYSEFGFEFESETKVFDLGFNISEDNRKVASIDPTSAAYEAGLREGDLLGRQSIYYGSLDHLAEFTVYRNGKEEPLSFLPVAIIDLPQLKDTSFNKDSLSF